MSNAPSVLAACLLALATPACKPAAPSCQDLAGTWRDTATGDLYEITAKPAGGYEMVARFDSSGREGDVWHAPVIYDLARAPSGLRGRQSQRRERPGQFCTVRRRIEGTCENDRMTLHIHRAGPLDWQPCRTGRSAGGADELALRAHSD